MFENHKWLQFIFGLSTPTKPCPSSHFSVKNDRMLIFCWRYPSYKQVLTRRMNEKGGKIFGNRSKEWYLKKKKKSFFPFDVRKFFRYYYFPRSCSKLTGEHLYRSAFSIKLLCSFIEIFTLQHGCSSVTSLHIFITLFPTNSSGGLLLFSRPDNKPSWLPSLESHEYI